VPNSANTQFFPGALIQKKTELKTSNSEDYEEDESPPFVGIPRIRISFSMEGDTYFKYTVAKDPIYIALKFYEMSSCSDIPMNYTVEVNPEINANDVITYNGK
jgi:hypothetical protein